MAEIYLGIGSNLGNREELLQTATVLVGQNVGVVSACSRYYESQPKNFSSENIFLNGALKLCSGLEPFEVLTLLTAIEVQLGRTKKGGVYQDRTIDIDLLLFGDIILSEPGLILPHPRLHLRRFVLVPLAEIAGGVKHPLTGKSINMLLQECQDNSWVKEYVKKT